MKSFFVFAVSLYSAFLMGDESAVIFSKDRMVQFYDEFLLEERELLAETGLVSDAFPTPDLFSPPPNPPAPPFKNGLLPVVLVNNSGYPDSQVFIVVTGDTIGTPAQQAWAQIDTSYGSDFGVATLVVAETGQSSTSYSYALSQLPRGSTGRVIYLPQITSGLLWVSLVNPLHMTVNGNSIVHPSPTDSSGADYATNFDTFELTYLASGQPQVSTDATAVSFFSIPLYGYLAGATSVSSNSGLYYPRSYIMQQAAAAFAAAPESSQWNKLILTQSGTILRCLSPGQAISASLFDENYLNNASYGYQYLSDIWTGTNAYYRNSGTNQHTLTMTVGVTVPSTATYTYTGQSNGSTFTFTSTDGGPTVTFQAESDGPPYTSSTTYNIFEGLNLVNPISQPTAGTAADAVSKLFEEALVAGILPTTNTVSLNSLVSNQAGYYQVNPNLTGSGGSTGPWYSLYSKAFHSVGSIYTYAYDDALWPQVLLGGPFVNNSTYIGITICNSK